MPEYTLTSCRPLGENDKKYGQSFWADALESNIPVRFSKILGDGIVAPSAGSKIEFETMAPKTSTKTNKPYMQLYKVNVVGRIEQPQTKEADDRIGDLLIIARHQAEMIKAIYTAVVTDDGAIDLSEPEPTAEQTGEVVIGEDEDIEEEKINLDDVPF
jgi:hypothetical protein